MLASGLLRMGLEGLVYSELLFQATFFEGIIIKAVQASYFEAHPIM